MLRVASFAALMVSLFGLAAYRSGGPELLERPLPANSTVANLFVIQGNVGLQWADAADAALADTAAKSVRVLMLNYTAYDSAYIHKMKTLLAKRLPGIALTDFWGGTPQQLSEALAAQDLVVITYPAAGVSRQIRAYGKVLKEYVQEGGAVLFSGTDQFGILQQYGLFDLDFGYFCSGMQVHEDAYDHPVLASTPSDFSLANYVYPLDISDANFITLADIRGYPAIGYKPIGNGKVVYLGMEYYYDEVVSSQILENTVRWLTPLSTGAEVALAGGQQPVENTTWQTRSAHRTEERLFAGSNGAAPATSTPTFDMKVYPNPYLEKATVDVNLEKSAPVTIEMTDETGGRVAVLLPYRVLSPGFYRVEVPNVAPGIYFVKCQAGNQTTVKKVVKVAAQ